MTKINQFSRCLVMQTWEDYEHYDVIFIRDDIKRHNVNFTIKKEYVCKGVLYKDTERNIAFFNDVLSLIPSEALEKLVIVAQIKRDKIRGFNGPAF